LLAWLSLATTIEVVDIQVNIKAEQPLVFHFTILRDHQDVLLCDQMLDRICNLFGLHCGPLYRGAHSLIQCHLCDDMIDDLTLLRRLQAFRLKPLDLADNEHRDALELFKSDFGLFMLWLCRLLLRGVLTRLLSSQLRLHPEQIVSVDLVLFLLAGFMNFLVDCELVIFELNIALNNVDVRCLEQTASLLHVGWPDHRVGVESGHGLGKTNQRLELPHSVAIRGLALSV